MSQSTRLVKAQVRITEWTKIFRDRQQSGLSVKEYCTRTQSTGDCHRSEAPGIRPADSAEAIQRGSRLVGHNNDRKHPP